MSSFLTRSPNFTTEIDFTDTPYTAQVGDDKIDVDATSGNVVINLYSITNNANKSLRIRKSDSSINTVTITAAGAETINGSNTLVISSQYVVRRIDVLPTEWGIF